MKAAIFLDRDGVVIENCSTYVRRWEDVNIFPAAIEVLRSLASSPYQIIFVTNQSAVGRGIISLETAREINEKLITTLSRVGCRVDGIFMCPHAPGDHCACRKPLPGLLFRAAEELNIDLAKSIMIGDAWTDVQAGLAAGVAKKALVLTGRGAQQLRLPKPAEIIDIPIYADLSSAISGLLPKF